MQFTKIIHTILKLYYFQIKFIEKQIGKIYMFNLSHGERNWNNFLKI